MSYKVDANTVLSFVVNDVEHVEVRTSDPGMKVRARKASVEFERESDSGAFVPDSIVQSHLLEKLISSNRKLGRIDELI